MQKERSKKRDADKAPFWLLIAVFLLIIGIVVTYSYHSGKNLEQYAASVIADNTVQVTREVDAYLSAALNSIQFSAHSAEHLMTESGLTDPAQLTAHLVERTPFTAIEYIDRDGINATELGERFDASDRVYYIEGIAGNTGIWINYAPKYSKEYLLDFYTPLMYENSIAGVLTGIIGADTLMTPLLTSSFFGEKMIGMLVDRDGTIIASTEPLTGVTKLYQALESYGVPQEDRQRVFREMEQTPQSVFRFNRGSGVAMGAVSVHEKTG